MNHISQKFDQQLHALHTRLGTLGISMVSVLNTIQLCMDHAQEQDILQAKLEETKQQMRVIFLLEAEADEESERILALYQPVASDLRIVIAVIRTLGEIQAIAQGLEQLVKLINRPKLQPSLTAMDRFHHLAGQVAALTTLCIEAMVQAMAKSDTDQGGRIIKQYKRTKQSYKRLEKILEKTDVHSDKTLMYSFRLAQEFLRIMKHNKLIVGHLLYLNEGKDVRHLSFKQMREMLELSMDHD